MSDNPVVHFEMPYEDAKRVTEFYKSTFGWDVANAGQAMGNYLIAATAETDENHMVKAPGTINGGFYDLRASPQSKEPSVVISVGDIEKAMQDIKRAGGQLLSDKPAEIPGIGLWISFRDTEGNRVSIMQARRG